MKLGRRLVGALVVGFALFSPWDATEASAQTVCGRSRVLNGDAWPLAECTSCPSGLHAGPVGSDPLVSAYVCVNP